MSISTPCIKICVIEPSLDICIGCGRTRREIGAWTGLPEPERLEIMKALPERIKGLTKRDSGRLRPSQRRRGNSAV